MTWHCSYCPNVTGSGSHALRNVSECRNIFNTQQDFVNHLKTYHLLVKAGRGGKTYVCCYGPSGSCVNTSPTPEPHLKTSFKSSFSTQKEYEQHLVLFHLLRCGNHRQPESATAACTSSNSVHSSPNGSRRAWSVFQAVVNLPAVLNDPDCRQLDIFSRTWGDQFERTEVTPSFHLPVITEQHFSGYLGKLSTSTASPRKTSAARLVQPERRESQSNGPVGARNSSASAGHCSTGMGGRFAEPCPAKPVLQRDRRSASNSLESIPPALFSPDFNLRHWRTFAQVIPLQQRGNLHPATSAVSDLETSPKHTPAKVSFSKAADSDEEDCPGARHSLAKASRSLQERAFHRQHEKLTQYLDVVEMHLAEQVSRKSSVFFEAVCCHDIVREQLKEALLQIKVVRSKLACVDISLTNSIMQLHQVVRRRKNCQALLARLHIIASLQATQPTIQVLLRQNDFCAALDLVAYTQDLLESSPQLTAVTAGVVGSGRKAKRGSQQQQHQPQQLTCLRHLNAQMEEISRIVRQMIVAEFEVVLQRFIETPNRATPSLVNSVSHRQQVADAAMPDLVPCLLGLIHIQRLDFVSAFKAELLRQVKAIVSAPPSAPETGPNRVNLTTSVGLQEAEPLTKEQLRSLSNEAWIQVVADKCTRLDGLLSYAEKAVDIFTTTMLDCASDPHSTADGNVLCPPSSSSSGCLSTATVANLIGQLTMTLGSVATAAQQHVLNLISPRLQQGNRVETQPAGLLGGNSEGEGEAKTTDLDPRSGSKAAATDSSLAGSNRLTLDQLICLVTVLQDFLENTYRTMHYEPPTDPGQQNQQTDPHAQSRLAEGTPAAGSWDTPSATGAAAGGGGGGGGASSNRAYSTSSASKLASLMAFTVRGLIHRFHADRCQKMKLMLHQERWEAVTVPRQLQDMVLRTFEVESEGRAEEGQSDRKAWTCRRPNTDSDQELRLDPNHSSSPPPPTAAETRADDVSSVLLLHGEPFMVVGTVLLLLPMLVDYAELATRLPLQPWSVEELADRVAVFLSLFNSGTCELVLGAGATESAVLPVITVRNLALASRSLQLVAKCVPSLSAYFQRLIAGSVLPKETLATGTLPGQGLETAADRDAGGATRRDSPEGTSYLANYLKVHHVRRKQNMLEHVDGLFGEHISGISNKLVQLLSDRISQHLIDWQVRPPTPSTHIRLICRAICRVAVTIGEIIPVVMLTSIILRAHNEFKVKLRERLSQLMVKADGGPQQSLVESELAFYLQQLRSLSSRLTKFNDDFTDIWPVS